jgi:hypothetical protein
LENGQGVAVPGTPLLPCPTPRRRVPSGRRLPIALAARAAVALVVLAVTACGAAKVRPAPFRARPDSVAPGSLLGPFDGKVVDAGTGEPVTGALVYATWTFQSGTALQSPSGYREAVTSTDGGGRYRLDRLRGLPGGGRVADFNLVIYKRGYVAYRSDRRFDDLGPRLDFAQRQNLVRLDKWRSDYSHVRHLRFVGGGPAIAALTRWEMPEAAAELAGVKAGPRVASDLVVGGGGALAASLVLTEQDIRSISHFDGTFETGPLNDEPDTDLYSSQHFRALGQPETFDVALRVWKLDSKTAEDRYGELLTTLPQVKEVNEIADRSMRAIESQIFGVGFLDRKRGVVVLITCGQSQCKSADVLVALGRKAHENIRRQVAESSGAEGEGAEPAPTAPGQPARPGATPGGLRPTPRPRPGPGPVSAPPTSTPTTPSPLSPSGQPREPKPAGSQDPTP